MEWIFRRLRNTSSISDRNTSPEILVLTNSLLLAHIGEFVQLLSLDVTCRELNASRKSVAIFCLNSWTSAMYMSKAPIFYKLSQRIVDPERQIILSHVICINDKSDPETRPLTLSIADVLQRVCLIKYLCIGDLSFDLFSSLRTWNNVQELVICDVTNVTVSLLAMKKLRRLGLFRVQSVDMSLFYGDFRITRLQLVYISNFIPASRPLESLSDLDEIEISTCAPIDAIFASELPSVTKIRLLKSDSRGINLAFPNARFLSIGEGEVPMDMLMLSGLTKLHEILVKWPTFKRVPAISGLKILRLESVNLLAEEMVDLKECLARFPLLEDITLTSGPDCDMSVFANLSQLKRVGVSTTDQVGVESLRSSGVTVELRRARHFC
jgi:hypothetical protein